MITAEDYHRVTIALGQTALDDIAWAMNDCKRPETAEEMAQEIIFVICNSGMHNKVARKIYQRVMAALVVGADVHTTFGHKRKSDVIMRIWRQREKFFAELADIKDDEALIEWAYSIPYIGKITCYHVAKNFGADVAKPDVHLQRLADREGVTAQQLCERLVAEVGTCVRAVDTVLWRACANGVINSNTGEIRLDTRAGVEPASPELQTGP